MGLSKLSFHMSDWFPALKKSRQSALARSIWPAEISESSSLPLSGRLRIARRSRLLAILTPASNFSCATKNCASASCDSMPAPTTALRVSIFPSDACHKRLSVGVTTLSRLRSLIETRRLPGQASLRGEADWPTANERLIDAGPV